MTAWNNNKTQTTMDKEEKTKQEEKREKRKKIEKVLAKKNRELKNGKVIRKKS